MDKADVELKDIDYIVTTVIDIEDIDIKKEIKRGFGRLE